MQLRSWLLISLFILTLQGPPPPHFSTVTAHIALPDTWTGSPGRWCCWRCKYILRRLCTGCSSGSGMTRGHGYAPLCARPESARREGEASVPEAGLRVGDWAISCLRPVSHPLPNLCPRLSLKAPTSVGGSGEHHRNLSVTQIENGTQFMLSSLASVPRLVWGKDNQGPPR